MSLHRDIRLIYVLILAAALLPLTLTGCEDKGGPPHGVTEVNTGDSYLAQDYDIYLVLAFPDKSNNPEKGKYITRKMVNDVLDYYHLLYKGNPKVRILLYRDDASAKQALTELLLGELVLEDGEPKLKMNHLL